MKTVAAICALPPERNTGMATVDLAAHTVLRRLVAPNRLVLYAMGKPGPHAYGKDELPYGHVDLLERPEEFLASDAFVYWGDFLHARAHWESQDDWRDASAEGRQTLQQTLSRYLFLAEKEDEELRRAMVFGGTTITNSATDFVGGEYAAAFTRFFRNAGAVLFRDALSAASISPLRATEATLACDCALLLEPEDLLLLDDFTPPTSRSGIGVFFGRSPSRLKLMAFSRLVAQELGESTHWLPWFNTRRATRAVARLAGYNIEKGQPSVGELLSQLSKCRFVVTDTYHLCVNAWRMGIPAICVGTGAAFSTGSLSDKKKEVLYETYGARPYYVFGEELSAGRLLGAARRSARSLANRALSNTVSQSITAHRAASIERLSGALARVLA